MPDSNNTNLPEINETSLHRIAKRVKKWQLITPKPPLTEYSYSSEIDQGLFDSEEYYEYEDKDFNLIYDKKLKKFLPIGEYLRVYLDNKNENIVKIESIKPFYWEEWSFDEDIERKNDIPKPDDGKIEDLILIKLKKDDLEKRNVLILNNSLPFVMYEFEINFTKIQIGQFTNSHHNIFDYTRIYFQKKVSLTYIIFEKTEKKVKTAIFGNTIFQAEVDFSCSIFEGRNAFIFTTFQKETRFNHAIFDDISFWYVYFMDLSQFIGSEFNNLDFADCIGTDELNFGGVVIKTGQIWSLCFQKSSQNKNEPKLDLSSANISNRFTLQPLIFKDQKIIIDLSNSYFENKLYFYVMVICTYKKWNNVILHLHNANFSQFVSDSRDITTIQLYKTFNEKSYISEVKKDNKSNKKFSVDGFKKRVYEEMLAERRIFRKILQDLHWGDKADEEYAKIMDLQTELKGSRGKIEKFVFSWLFGWGVRIKNILISGVFFNIILLCNIWFFRRKLEYSGS